MLDASWYTAWYEMINGGTVEETEEETEEVSCEFERQTKMIEKELINAVPRKLPLDF